ncbi:hypothetical protein DSUL_20243 [Desulfovibrionales bacterium]
MIDNLNIDSKSNGRKRIETIGPTYLFLTSSGHNAVSAAII